MSRRRHALGDQALHLIKETAIAAQEIDRKARKALRTKIEAASQRPAPGTSDLLGRPMMVQTTAGIDDRTGKMRAVDTYDLVGMAPIHWKRH